MHGASQQPELFLIGLGVTVPDHITFQATRAMLHCSQIYSLIQESSHLWIPPGHTQKVEIVDVRSWYIEGELRTRNYDRVAETIFKAVSRGKSIGYVTYGNPMAYDSVAQNLAHLASAAGLSIQVVPGVSSLDTVLCDLRLDMAPAIQVFDASWFVAYRIQPQVDIPLLLMQVGAFGSFRTHYSKLQDGSSLQDLVRYCCEVYPSTFPVSLVRSSAGNGVPAQVRQVSLARLIDVTADDLSGASLYIPTLRKGFPEQDLLARMQQI
jgi:uncharacterized protein YabN with tetrapyrrole methylase and pyrophosphatase domain